MWTRTFHAKGREVKAGAASRSSVRHPPVLGMSWLGEQTEGTLRREAVLRVRWGWDGVHFVLT